MQYSPEDLDKSLIIDMLVQTGGPLWMKNRLRENQIWFVPEKLKRAGKVVGGYGGSERWEWSDLNRFAKTELYDMYLICKGNSTYRPKKEEWETDEEIFDEKMSDVKKSLRDCGMRYRDCDERKIVDAINRGDRPDTIAHSESKRFREACRDSWYD
jgi:hypothetical protein